MASPERTILIEKQVIVNADRKEMSWCWIYFVTQWAAVRTHWVPIKAPPHRYWFKELINATCSSVSNRIERKMIQSIIELTCQQNSPGRASEPPTTRPVRIPDTRDSPEVELAPSISRLQVKFDMIVCREYKCSSYRRWKDFEALCWFL